tara:strand:- start:1236 stop:1472 length:237 start_codon:yes stop_codon:yes gene_type:complete
MIRTTPDYYVGKNGYVAEQVVYGFNCTWNVGNAVTYLLRAGKKTEKGMTDLEKHLEDLEKAIHHLQYEIKNLKTENKI